MRRPLSGSWRKPGMTIESDETHFHVKAARALLVNGTVKYSKEWQDSIKRNLV